mgnify:CR=1 FL=1
MIQYPWTYVNSVRDFYLVLRELHQKDPEQEIQGAAVIAYNKILEDAKAIMKGKYDH